MIRLTAKDIADYLGLSTGYIRCLLAGRRIPLKQNAFKLILDIIMEKQGENLQKHNSIR